MKRKAHIILLVLLLLCVLSTTAFAIDESEVESAIAASSKEEVAGNVFIWFLCAIGFLKVSQKIDSFMASLGINVGRTGGSMLTELMVAGRGIAAVAGAVGGTVAAPSALFTTMMLLLEKGAFVTMTTLNPSGIWMSLNRCY